MSQIIDGEKIAEKIKDRITKEIFDAKIHPNLAIILVGEKKDSKIYVNLKEKEAKKVGIDTHLYRCNENSSEEEILEIINYLNNDPLIDAILVQLPLPAHADTNKIVQSIKPEKDVDRFNKKNIIEDIENENLLPPVYAVILEMLKNINCEIKDKNICILSNSDIFGKNLVNLLKKHQAKVELSKKGHKDLEEKTRKADILISALGEANFITKSMVKKDAIVIDVGINEKKGKIVGDVDFHDVEDKTSFISPVPGGVGPLTIAMTFDNTLKLYKQKTTTKTKKEKENG